MSLMNQRAEYIVTRVDPSDLLGELRSITALSPDAQRTLDFVLRQWTLKALSRSTDTEGLLELDDLAALGMRALPQGAESSAFRTRWRAFRDLIESKLLAIEGRESGRARNLLHSGPILQTLRAGPMPQSELQAALGLSAQRLSQVLGVMEEGGLIQRQKRGKEKLVSLVLARELSPALAPGASGVGAGVGVGATVWPLAGAQVA